MLPNSKPPLNKICLKKSQGRGQHSNSKFLEPYGWDGGEGGGRGGGGEEGEEEGEGEGGHKIGVAEKSFHYCHAWCRFVIAILGLAKGVPFVDLFSCFFNKGFIRESAVW